jgi:RHS repeat-associated protein
MPHMQLSPSRPSKCRNAGFQIIRHCPRISRPRTHLRTDGQNITGIVDNVTAANSATFAAGNAGRLQNADGPWGSKTFYFDGVGNRSTEISTVGGVSTTDNYGYPANNNRLVQITRGAATVAALTYDAGGNLLTDNRASGNKTYTYNKRNRLATATVGALSYAYTYNGREQLAIRQKTTAPVATTHFVHDIFGNVLAETSGTAAGTVREYIWLPETEIAPTREAMSQVDRPLAVVNGVGTTGVAVWNVSVDHLNRPVLMTNSLKVAMWTAVWQPWGGAHSVTGTATLDTRFPGQWYQSETGLHYNWHRSYDPTVGRYTQPDPLGFVDGPSVYGYAKGKPQSLVDPTGLASEVQRCGVPKRRPVNQCNSEFPQNGPPKWFEGDRYDANDPACYQNCAKNERKSCQVTTVLVCPPVGVGGGPGAGLGCIFATTYVCEKIVDRRCKFACRCFYNDQD